jgi:hypothetical protein
MMAYSFGLTVSPSANQSPVVQGNSVVWTFTVTDYTESGQDLEFFFITVQSISLSDDTDFLLQSGLTLPVQLGSYGATWQFTVSLNPDVQPGTYTCIVEVNTKEAGSQSITLTALVNAVTTLLPSTTGVAAPLNLSAIPLILQFADYAVLCLGNRHPIVLVDNAGNIGQMVNHFVTSYPAPYADTYYNVGDQVAALDKNGVEWLFQAVQAGASAGTPSMAGQLETSAGTGPGATANGWPSAYHATVGDGAVVWQNIGSATNTPCPRGAAHAESYAGALWVLNTYPKTTSDQMDGPTVLRMSDVNNPNSWNPLNVAFLGRDDGDVGTGLCTFTIATEGISPVQSLLAFKNFELFQILGVFGAADFAIQQAQTDMGNVAPRSLQFLPGLGVIRLSHRGFAVFTGVRDQLISEEIRPYLFGDESAPDITPIDWSLAWFGKGAQSADPPMYVCALPLEPANGTPNGRPMTRLFCLDIVLKAWTICDLPWPISAIKQIFVTGSTALPLTVSVGYYDGVLRQLFNNANSGWADTPSIGTATPVAWSVRPAMIANKSVAELLYLDMIYLHGKGQPNPISIQLLINQVPNGFDVMKLISPPAQRGQDWQAFMPYHQIGDTFEADFKGTGPILIESFDWEVVPQPAAPRAFV